MNAKVFDSELNEYCRRFLVKNAGGVDPSPMDFILRTKAIDAALFEYFLLFDTVSFKVFGENIPLIILLNRFGVKGTEALIEQGAINFVLWNPLITYFVDDIPGVDPLQSGVHNSPAHSDPEESIKLGFGWMRKQPRMSEQRNLIRKVRDLYTLPDDNLPGSAVSIAKSSYESGKLEVYGLTPDKSSFRDLDLKGRKKICHCADDILQYSHLISNNMTSFYNFEFYKIFNDSVRKIYTAANLQGNFNEICMLEGIPDLRSMYPGIDKPFSKVVKLRGSGSSKKFRKWLSDCTDSENSLSVTKEYIEAISNAKGFFETKVGRFTKNVAMSAVGAGMGMLISNNVSGAVAGVATAKILEPAADFGLDMLDEFVLSGLTKGWTPKIFLGDIEKLTKKP
ncbi:hypothetical protein D3C79_161900 [compost metagenome]